MRSSKTRLGIGAVAALILGLAWWGTGPAGAQTTTLPDAHYCEVSGTSPYNVQSGVIAAQGTVRCYTDGFRSAAGQVQSIGIRIDLYYDLLGDGEGVLVYPKDVPTSPPSNERTVGLTYPDPATSGDVLCQSGRYYTKVTGSALFKSGTPTSASFTIRTPTTFVSCESRMTPPVIDPPVIPPSPPTRPPTPPGRPCTRPPCPITHPEE